MSVSIADGVSATLVQPTIYRGIVEPTQGRIGDLWEDTSGGTPILKHCTSISPLTWSAVSTGGGGSSSFTTVEVDLATTKPRNSGSFTITSSGMTTGKPVNIFKASGPYTGKGTLADEAEMDSIQVTGEVANATTIQCYWNSVTLVKGNHKFNYLIGA